MRKFMVAAVILLLTLNLAAMSTWSSVADKLADSVLFLEVLGEDGAVAGSCSGFMIDSQRKHVMTAAHCDGPKVLANGTPTIKVWKDERKDLLVLRAYGVDAPALKLAAKSPDRGEEVASMGYGFAFEQPMFRITHVSNVGLEIEGLSGPYVVVDSQFVGGQSGGPVVNDKGEVVMIVQRGGSGVGIGLGADTIRDRAKKYFSEVK